MALRLAIFGQARFGRDVACALAEQGHRIVGVYVPPDRDSQRPDPLAVAAAESGWPLFRHPRFRCRGAEIPEIVEEHRALGADLNVLPYTTVLLPMSIIRSPARGSLCFHPSLLPAFRGGAAIPWQIILGATQTGVSVFRPDEGVDTGPIVLQRGGVPIDSADTAASLYFDKIYPLGVKTLLEAVAQVDSGTDRAVPQAEARASFQGLVTDSVARIDWERPAAELDRLIRGCDPQPGAWADLHGSAVRLYDVQLRPGDSLEPAGRLLGYEAGRLRVAVRGGELCVGKLRLAGGPKQSAAAAGLELGGTLG